MCKKLVIIGASGQGKVVADIALKLQKYDEIVFLDDDESIKECMNFPIVGTSVDAKQFIGVADFFVAIGNAKIRKKVTAQLQEAGATITTLVHPMATIGDSVTIGMGTVVMAGAIINPDSVIGQGCIINTCASVDHDCNLGDYVHISVGAHVCGSVKIGENTWVGAGSTVSNNLNVCENCMVGAGALVVRNIEEEGTYVGVPVRKMIMTKKKKVLLVAHFCDYGNENTNNRFNYIAQLLHENDFEVELVTSSFSHRDKVQREGVSLRDYKMTLIYEPTYKKNVSIKRFFYSHYIMSRNLKKYLQSCEKPDVIYCAIPSLDVAYVVKEYAEKNQIPFVIDVQDLWPEAFQMVFNIPILSDIVFGPIRSKADNIYKSANAVVSVSETYARRVMRNNVKCDKPLVVYLGTDLQAYDRNIQKLIEYNKEDDIWIAYCGTLGHSYDLTRVFKVLNILRKRDAKGHKFIVMGDGPLRDSYEKIAQENHLPVVFTGKLKYDDMCAMLDKCDICINPISTGAAQSIINKHADYAASGLPVVSTQENEEYKQMIESYKMGFNCDESTDEQMADILEELFNQEQKRKKMGKNARKCAEELFDRRNTYMQIVNLISQTMKSREK